MLKHLGEKEAANAIEKAVMTVCSKTHQSLPQENGYTTSSWATRIKLSLGQFCYF